MPCTAPPDCYSRVHFFLQRKEIDEAWRKAARLAHEGVLGSAVKGVTYVGPWKHLQVMCVYVNNFADKV